MSFVYIFISGVRSGNLIEFNFFTFLDNLPIGVEFADYVYSYNNIKEHEILKYDFILSSLGSFFNSSFLSFLGFDKSDLINSGSDTVWMNLYGISQGVRTGIVNELFFAFGKGSIVFFYIGGILLNRLNLKMLLNDDLFLLMFYCSIYVLIFFLIVGQATVFFGTLTTLIYFFVFNQIVVFFSKKMVGEINGF
jgi:hypothetical protein